MNATDAATGQRVDWVDFAKGLCIIWVVALYSTDFVQENTHTVGWMQAVADFARPFRMPDFFLLSGLFVSRVLNRSWRAYIDSKVLYFAYFYMLWATFKFLNMHAGDLLDGDLLALAPQYLRLLVEPPTGPLWFIYILAVFFIAVRVLRRVPPAIVFALAALLQMLDVDTGVKVVDKFSQYFVYFYSGYLFARHVFRAAAWARAHASTVAVLLLLWFAMHLSLFLRGWSLLPGLNLALGFAGVGAVMLFATLCARTRWMRWLGYMGRNSIVVYLGFVVPLGLMRRFIVSPPVAIDAGTLSLIVTVLAIMGALLLYRAVRRTPLRFLFARPAWTSILRAPPLLVKTGAPG
jgi:uncharacterized membrane protein YcfT